MRDALYNGKSGIVYDPVRKEMGFRSALAARLEVPDLKGVLSRPQRAYMPEQAKCVLYGITVRQATKKAYRVVSLCIRCV